MELRVDERRTITHQNCYELASCTREDRELYRRRIDIQDISDWPIERRLICEDDQHRLSLGNVKTANSIDKINNRCQSLLKRPPSAARTPLPR
tara:strand:+ start:42 stop:320 length:279 start_codon:yes stop_codon:yes gene_type:complete